MACRSMTGVRGLIGFLAVAAAMILLGSGLSGMNSHQADLLLSPSMRMSAAHGRRVASFPNAHRMSQRMPSTFRSRADSVVSHCAEESSEPAAPAELSEEVTEAIAAHSQQVIAKMSRLYSGTFDFGYDIQSVGYVDELIDRNRRGWIREGSEERMLTLFGAYLGEAMIKQYGGKWVDGYGVQITEGFVANPFVKVAKRIQNGIEEDSIESYFRMTGVKLAEFQDS
uniref:DUF3806 domain-containing protein n=1 Tax=Lotharella globosa TaxID=91324 RepID=A0A6U3E2Q9_9EUKA|mmetsp:Transcript_14791/g.29981  ORF Transcript_14791/g.29981 Transcript_14791/m.29981 type:complete len:226 (+) Transcript_14791:36-713(+)